MTALSGQMAVQKAGKMSGILSSLSKRFYAIVRRAFSTNLVF
jgi:hypothetical protein